MVYFNLRGLKPKEMPFQHLSEPRKIIKKNYLIQGSGPIFSMEQINAFKMLSKIATTQQILDEKSNSMENYNWLSDSMLQFFLELYGDEGFFKLHLLSMCHGHS